MSFNKFPCYEYGQGLKSVLPHFNPFTPFFTEDNSSARPQFTFTKIPISSVSFWNLSKTGDINLGNQQFPIPSSCNLHYFKAVRSMSRDFNKNHIFFHYDHKTMFTYNLACNSLYWYFTGILKWSSDQYLCHLYC